MKKAAKSLKLNILGVVFALLGVGIPLGIYGITCIPSVNADPFPYIYLMFALAFLLKHSDSEKNSFLREVCKHPIIILDVFT